MKKKGDVGTPRWEHALGLSDCIYFETLEALNEKFRSACVTSLLQLEAWCMLLFCNTWPEADVLDSQDQ